MPIATPEQYAEMLDTAKAKGFAFPAFNVSSSQTLNAVLQGLTEAGSDGIIQVTTGGADYFAGHTVKARATGALAFARFAHEVAKSYPITVALHTDHCPKNALDDFVYPLIAASEDEVKAGRNPIFQSHMWDGSAVPLDENLEIAKQILPRMKAINAILEVEIGVVGGEEDGVSHDINEHLYTTLDDAVATVEALGLGEQGRYMAALTFGNVHGVYAPGNVKLKPELLKEIQDGLAAQVRHGAKPLDLVFHGGSGSTDEEIATAVANGVVKMNIDTDTQYAFTRSVAGYMLSNYEGVLKVDGSVGNKKQYDPARLGQGRRVGDGRARRRVHPAARLRRAVDQRLGSGCRSSTPRGTPRSRPNGRRPGSPRPHPHHARSVRARSSASTRPRAGRGSRRRERPRPTPRRSCPRRRHRASARALAAASVDGGATGRPADRAVTILLLVIGVLGVWLAVGVLQAMPESIQLLHTQEGIEPYTPGPRSRDSSSRARSCRSSSG